MPDAPYKYPEGLTPLAEGESVARATVQIIEQYAGDIVAEYADLDGFAELVLRYKLEEARVLCSKQRDYGPSNIGACPVGPVAGLVVRLFDKIARLGNLERTGRLNQADNESGRDTTGDIANYGTIGTMVLDGNWPAS